MRRLDDQAFIGFWRNVAEVTAFVQDKLVNASNGQLAQLTIDVQHHFDGVIDPTFSFAQDLLDELAETSVGYRYADADQPPPWFAQYLAARVANVKKGRAMARIDEFLMEQLTAIWLLLYFLSVPIGHPWERVRRIADEQGGYPVGACMTKMIGDVYRRMRLEIPEPKADAPPVVVLSMYPSILIKELLDRPDVDKMTPSSLHKLGRCYALFQLRLYVAEGRRLRYIVKLPAFKRSWELFPDLPSLADDKASSQIRRWMTQMFPDGRADLHEVLLYRGRDKLSVSPCTLGCKSGVYALESSAEGTHFVGNKVNKQLLASLRERLLQKPPPYTVSLVGKNAEELHQALQFEQRQSSHIGRARPRT